MKISLNWVRDFVDLPADVTPQQIAQALTMATVEVEQVHDAGKPLELIVVGSVRAVEPHPSSDTLRVADVDHGSVSTRVVSGAPNLAAGMKVALALPGAVIRDAEGKERTVANAVVRGAESAGWLCTAAECGLDDAFPGGEKELLDLTQSPAAPGTPLAAAVGYDDFVLEIDNKSLTNRPDLWGHHGIARELAALFDRPLQEPAQFGAIPPAENFEVLMEAPELCGRYTATHVTGVTPGEAPLWMRTRLAKVGQRSINLLVDLTNYVMFAVGQPTHAFDARDIAHQIVVRRAKQGERLVLLDDKEVELDPDVLVIANHEEPLGLGGVMGGKRGIRPDTREIWLEVANFEPVPLRRTTRRFGLRTESSTRYEKGVDLPRIDLGRQLFLALLTQAMPDCRVVGYTDAVAKTTQPVHVDVPVTFLHRRLGIELPAAELRALLLRLQFGCKEKDGVLHVDVPSWRATGDVSLPEDIVEEVARLYGYENLPFTPPAVRLEKPVIQLRSRTERRVKEYLGFRAGMREVVSYPWVTAQSLDAAGMSGVATIGLAQPPTADARLAPSLIPNMLSNVALNLRYQQQFRIFELARVFLPPGPSGPSPLSGTGESLPHQPHHIAAALVGADAGTLFLEAKAILDRLARAVQVAPLAFGDDSPAPWGDPAARLAILSNGTPIGVLAVATARAKRKAGIRRAEVALFELDADALTPLASRTNVFTPLPTYPVVEFDISLIVPRAVRWTEALSIASQADPLVRSVSFVDEYIGAQVPDDRKSLTLRLHLGSDEGTLVREQIDATAAKVIEELTGRLGGVVRRG